MSNLERRLRNLETRRPADEEIVIEILYVNEPPKSPLDEPGELASPRPSWHGPRVKTIYLDKGDSSGQRQGAAKLNQIVSGLERSA